jgi:hypothetical protein
MTQGAKDQIKGSIFLLIFVGIPLGFIFTPMITLFFLAGALWGLARESKKPAIVNKAKVRVNNAKLSKDDEELITTILPIINRK